jgi:hypothetical protein
MKLLIEASFAADALIWSRCIWLIHAGTTRVAVFVFKIHEVHALATIPARGAAYDTRLARTAF